MPAQVFIDGSEITSGSLAGSSTRRLNRPSQATVRVPNHLAVGGAGSRMKILFNGNLHHHGFVLLCETNPEEDTGYTVYNSTDPMELWQWRPCRDYGGETPGNLIDPSFLTRMETGPQIMEEIFLASENPAGIPTTAEGPLFMELGFFEGGGSNLKGAPATYPFTIAEMFALLSSTGELDAILTPIDSGGNMARVDCHNGDYGTDLSGSIIFEYGMGARNIRTLRWNQDLTNVSNKIQYFFAPKETIRRYKGNITGDDPCLDVQIGAGNMAALEANRLSSRGSYGTRFDFQEFEVAELATEQDPPGTCVYIDPTRAIYRRNWFQESSIRWQYRTLVHITPTRETAIGSFDIGDLVRVRCTPAIRGGFDGVQRVYEYTISWDDDGVLALSELQTSADQG